MASPSDHRRDESGNEGSSVRPRDPERQQQDIPSWAAPLFQFMNQYMAQNMGQAQPQNQNREQERVPEREPAPQRRDEPENRLGIMHEFIKLKPPRFSGMDSVIDPHQFLDQLK